MRTLHSIPHRAIRTAFLNTVRAGGLAAVLVSAGALAADPSSYDKKFMEKAADAGSTEIEASKLAGTKAANPTVKEFAGTMVTDHTKVADELKALAGTKNVTLSDAPSKAHQNEIKKLGAMEGAKFDSAYTSKIGVAAHKDAVKLFTDASKKATDPDVKAFATKTLPGLQHHLEMATKLAGDIKTSTAAK